jgi:hypothetical protein
MSVHQAMMYRTAGQGKRSQSNTAAPEKSMGGGREERSKKLLSITQQRNINVDLGRPYSAERAAK